jgi:UDP-N-acetylglucosamine transferase subunit ALG13
VSHALARSAAAREHADRPAVLVSVGTDIHPFDRLMDWLERWYETRPDRPTLLVQHGHTRAPTIPGAVPFLDHETLHRAMAGTTLVVSHGGPATIMECRRHGRMPLVVPRDPDRGEHVGDNQELFARRLANDGLIRLCGTGSELAVALDEGLAAPRLFRLESQHGSLAARAAAVARVGQIIEGLIRPR